MNFEVVLKYINCRICKCLQVPGLILLRLNYKLHF